MLPEKYKLLLIYSMMNLKEKALCVKTRYNKIKNKKKGGKFYEYERI